MTTPMTKGASSKLRRALILASAAVLFLPATRAAASVVGGADELPPELVVLLNGAPYDGEHASRLDGCTIELDMSGLGATPEAPVPIVARIAAIAPTVPEGSSEILVDEQLEATADSWSADYPMVDLLAGYGAKPNGYRLAVQVSVNGRSLGERQLWLACGAAQTGHPNRILFEKVWLDTDGNPVTDLDAVLPAGWREELSIVASSTRGTAVCTYPEGSDELVCEFDNPGHGEKPGLVVPNGMKHTYEVEEIGLPEGWEVDPSTVGTFVGRETCGRGGGHEGGEGHDGGGGHESTLVAAAEEGGGHDGGGATCTHEVVNRQLPVPPVPPPPPPPPPVVEPQVAEPAPTVLPAPQVLGVTQTRTTLPATGAAARAELLAGGLLLAVGGLLLIASRVAGRRQLSPA